ncbi:hypothetical protein, partial [Escherichia coli]|uniref:hypothetical protein n=1 Tax=Escherichia coli TaxID=562 RepID=UPI001F210F37
ITSVQVAKFSVPLHLSKTSSAAFQRCHHLSSPAGTGVPLVVQPFAIALKIQTWATVVIECGLQEF